MDDQTPPETPATPLTSEPGPIPYARFQTVERERDALRAQIETLTGERQTLAQRLGAMELDLALTERGFTQRDEARVAVEAYWSRLPEEGRPPVAEWVRSLDPATAPRAVAAYLSPAAPAASAPSSAPASSAAVGSTPPPVPAAAPAQPAAPPPMSPTQALQGANKRLEAAIRSRNPAEIDAARAEVSRLLVAPARATV